MVRRCISTCCYITGPFHSFAVRQFKDQYPHLLMVTESDADEGLKLLEDDSEENESVRERDCLIIHSVMKLYSCTCRLSTHSFH